MIGFVLLCHVGKLRTDGDKLMHRCVDSLQKSLKNDHRIVIIDNGSESPMTIPSGCHLVRIEDQMVGGFSHAFNVGIEKALSLGCHIINLVNDDVVFNNSISNYLEVVDSHPHKNQSIFGPTTKGATNKKQRREKIVDNPKVIETKAINGFFMTFTDVFCDKFHLGEKRSDMFLPEPKFAGVEHAAFQDQLVKRGVKILVVEHGWFQHDGRHGWRSLK